MPEILKSLWTKYGPLGIAMGVMAWLLLNQQSAASEERKANRDLMVNHLLAVQNACLSRSRSAAMKSSPAGPEVAPAHEPFDPLREATQGVVESSVAANPKEPEQIH